MHGSTPLHASTPISPSAVPFSVGGSPTKIIPGTCGSIVSYLVPIGVNSPTTVIPSSIASRIGGTTALPSLACTTNAWYSPEVIAFWICDTCLALSKLGSKNLTSMSCLAASSLTPAYVACANEFAEANPKNATFSTLVFSPAAPESPPLSSEPQPANAPTASASSPNPRPIA